MEFTTPDSILKARGTPRLSKSHELNKSQANKALGTFKAFNSKEFKQKPASSSRNVSEEVADSTQKGPNIKKGRPRKGANIEPRMDASDEHIQTNRLLARERKRTPNL